MTSSDLDLRLMRFRSRGEEQPHALASALIGAGRSQDALEVIHLGLLSNEQDAELFTLEGRALYEQGELHQAQSALVRAAKANPDSKEPYRWLAQVLIERGDPTRAAQVLERAIMIDPEDASLRQAHARALRLLQREARVPGAPAPAGPAGPVPPPRALGPTDLPTGPRLEAVRSSPLGGPLSRAANQNAALGMPAMARAPRTRDATAQELMPEVASDPAPSRAPQSVESSKHALPFDDEVDRDDESPTTAVEIPDELRNWLRAEPPTDGFERRGFGEEAEDESEPTSIVPAAAELELLRQQAQYGDFDDSNADRTLIVEDAHMFEVPTLAQPGEAEPPEQVLSMLRAQGVFEPSAQPPASWAQGSDVPRSGMSITKALGLAWLIAMLAAIGGYYGFDAWLVKRRADARELVDKAWLLALDGQHESLVGAERSLFDARTLDPKSHPALEQLLFVQAAKALEGGAEEFAPVRETLQRAEQAKLDTPLVQLVRVLVRPGPLDLTVVDDALTFAQRAGGEDARTTYVAGRLAQRIGRLDLAEELLAHAATREPRMGLAFLARAEQARAEGQLERAREQLDKALGDDGKQLRAELWQSVLDAKPTEGKELLRKLEALKPRLERGSAADQLLSAGARAFALMAEGDSENAQAALRDAAKLRVSDPEPLAFFSEQALRAGETALAYRAARAANQAGGSAPRYQSLLASVLLQQGEGDAALNALGNVGEGHGALALARAAAALLADSREALERAKRELASYRATADGKTDPEATSIMIRVDMRLGANVESLLPAARALVQRSPETASAHLALAEALVNAEQGPQAIAALEPALKLAPGSADGHYLMGGAQRLAGHPKEARSSLERAVAIAPNHLEARRALGRMLLDSGDFDAALQLFRGLEGAGGDSAKLGAIEALLGKHKLDEAATRIDALPEHVKASLAGELLKARLDVARGKPQAAVDALTPLVDEHAETRSADGLVVYGEALYALGRVDSAALAFDGALELDDKHPDALLGRATAAIHAEKADQTSALVERAQAALALRARPPRTHARALVLAGRAELGKGQIAKARESLARAVAITDAPADAHFWYAEVLTRARDASARDEYEKYVQLEPTGALVARAKRALSVR